MRCDKPRKGQEPYITVSIHTPTWGVTVPLPVVLSRIAFQSTHLHEVWLQPRYLYSALLVSIHTPTWGVTKILHSSRLLLKFQSTHLHEVWLSVLTLHCWSCSFNPHTYMRCDKNGAQILETIASFNPHTYMRCDFNNLYRPTKIHRFNPHTYMRCDVVRLLRTRRFRVSIHTPTWGVTWFCWIRWHILIRFNPHTYMRCDSFDPFFFDPIVVSIHTPTWGVTRIFTCPHMSGYVSIHTPTWGVTFISSFFDGSFFLFQSTHLHEVWHSYFVDFFHDYKFQSTHLHEVWPLCDSFSSVPWSFNPHTYMRCDTRIIRRFNQKESFNPHTYMRCDRWSKTIIVAICRFNPHTYMRCDLWKR